MRQGRIALSVMLHQPSTSRRTVTFGRIVGWEWNRVPQVGADVELFLRLALENSLLS